jgi:hypothetical protein
MKWLITYETIVKPPYILIVIYPIAIVMVKIHSPAMAMIPLISIVLVVCNSSSPFQAKALTRPLQYFGKGYWIP